MDKIIDYDNIKPIYRINHLGEIYNINSQQYLQGSLDKDGYKRYGLTRQDGSKKTYKAHRLVLISFKPCENYEQLQVNHKDGNKLNNNINNLEWCTCKENIHHAIKNNLRGKSRAILNPNQVKEICSWLEKGYGSKMIAQKMFPQDVEQYTNIIYDIKRQKNWTDISKNYNISVPYKYGNKFKSSYTIWELEDICAFIAQHLNEPSNTKLAREFFQDPSITYKSSKVKLIKDIKTKQKYNNVSKYYF